jgi:hypothetical protein
MAYKYAIPALNAKRLPGKSSAAAPLWDCGANRLKTLNYKQFT